MWCPRQAKCNLARNHSWKMSYGEDWACKYLNPATQQVRRRSNLAPVQRRGLGKVSKVVFYHNNDKAFETLILAKFCTLVVRTIWGWENYRILRYSEKGIHKYNFFSGLLRSFPRNLVAGYLGGLIPSSLFGAFWCLKPCGLNVPIKSEFFGILDVKGVQRNHRWLVSTLGAIDGLEG